MRLIKFAEGEYYHVCSRSTDQKQLFFDDVDKARFLFLILHFQSPTPIHNTGWYAHSFLKKQVYAPTKSKLSDILKTRYIELVAFAMMPNHFHLLLKNMEDQILSIYMHRVLTAYSKYFATKYKKPGHVFQGPFRAVHIKNNVQLLHTSAYIHKNPIDIKELGNDILNYQWSSYQDYVSTNRWGKLLETKIVSEQFNNQNAYRNFVETSMAKEKIPWLDTSN